MPLINSPLPRAPQPRFRQGSSLRSNRDGDRPDRAWSKTDKHTLAITAAMQELAKVKQDLGRLRRRIIGGGGGSTESVVVAFAISTLGNADFFIARQLSNFRLVADVPTADVTGKDVKIAKSPLTRRSVLEELIDGFVITYRDTGTDTDNNRIANDGATDESQCVYPRYTTLTTLGFTTTVATFAQCVIYAARTNSLSGVIADDGSILDWIELQPARVWAKRFAP